MRLYRRLARQFQPDRFDRSRRDFLAHTTGAAVGLAVASPWTWAEDLKLDNRPRVIVVGAGFAGLACAYELRQAGCDVEVLEARPRLGGRVLSFNAELGTEFVPRKNVEGGGELIGSNHPTWVRYAKHFGLEFLNVSEDEELEWPIVIGGQKLDEHDAERLWAEMDVCLSRLNDLAAEINIEHPWLSPRAHQLDAVSLQDWLDGNADTSELCRHLIALQQSGDNGVATEKQSLLAVLTAIAGGGGEDYWTDSEVFRCRGGNQQLAFKLADGIGNEQIHLNTQVQSIDQSDDSILVSAVNGKQWTADYVVVAAPPSTWPKMSMNPKLPDSLQPQMGLNTKYLARVKERFWQLDERSQYSLHDVGISGTWDGTDGQGDEGEYSFHCFSGGKAAEEALALSKETRDKAFAHWLDAAYEGFGDAFLSSRFMDWPRDPWTMASYSFPAPRQVCTQGPDLVRPHGRMFLAGEHTCYAFVGYMEGALQSGNRVAKEILSLSAIRR